MSNQNLDKIDEFNSLKKIGNIMNNLKIMQTLFIVFSVILIRIDIQIAFIFGIFNIIILTNLINNYFDISTYKILNFDKSFEIKSNSFRVSIINSLFILILIILFIFIDINEIKLRMSLIIAIIGLTIYNFVIFNSNAELYFEKMKMFHLHKNINIGTKINILAGFLFSISFFIILAREFGYFLTKNEHELAQVYSMIYLFPIIAIILFIFGIIFEFSSFFGIKKSKENKYLERIIN